MEGCRVSCLGQVSGLLISPKICFVFFLSSDISKKRLLLCMPKFSIINFRILWSTKSNSTEIRRNINLYFPVIICRSHSHSFKSFRHLPRYCSDCSFTSA